jgi:hypothetical protein
MNDDDQLVTDIKRCRTMRCAESEIIKALVGPWGRARSHEYDGETDFARAREYGFALIRERMAAGGPGWHPATGQRRRGSRSLRGGTGRRS